MWLDFMSRIRLSSYFDTWVMREKKPGVWPP
jgi:hypothetical protein